MLKHEGNFEASSQSAAQKRVTPAELASAIARLEAKREREADGTVAIGEAVRELGLAATPEAVWAEVEVVRAQRAEANRKKGRNVGLFMLLSSVVLGVFIGLRVTRTDPPERQTPPTVAATLPAPQAPPQSITVDPHLMVGDPAGRITPGKIVDFSEVGDNQPVLCGYVYGAFEPYSFNGSGPFWTVVKHQGQVYVRGWMGETAQQVRQKNGADVAQDSSPGFSIPVTLALNGFKVVPKDDDHTEFHVVDVHLDKHAYEKWEQ